AGGCGGREESRRRSHRARRDGRRGRGLGAQKGGRPVIRINLLGGARQEVKKAATMPSFDLGQRLTFACSLILVASLLGIGWWYWSLTTTATELDAEIARSQREAAQLKSLLKEV